jgi:hypothetical protein
MSLITNKPCSINDIRMCERGWNVYRVNVSGKPIGSGEFQRDDGFVGGDPYGPYECDNCGQAEMYEWDEIKKHLEREGDSNHD